MGYHLNKGMGKMRNYLLISIFGWVLFCTNAFAELVSNGDGTVSDTKTGLMWQQSESEVMDWTAALSYCENLQLANHNDWRLPNRNELQSLVDYSVYNPSIDTIAFPGATSSSYWSSTTRADNSGYAWDVHFYDGHIHGSDKTNSCYVRAVRGGTSISADSDGDGTNDDLDGCPNDPSKIEPGTCGCGIPETDTNSDGEPDCIDDDDDGDGMLDDYELQFPSCLDPKTNDGNSDCDEDGLTNIEEFQNGINPTLSDTDADGFADKYEIESGTNPIDHDSVPYKYGTTVITHGFTFDFTNADWTKTMAEAIGSRAGRYNIHFFKEGYWNGTIRVPDSYDNDRENIIVFNWEIESDRNIQGYAEAAADALSAILIKEASYGLSLERLHFIGHSRGTVVNSECIQRLILLASTNNLPEGVRIDENIHMTTLDPHPWDDDLQPGTANDNGVNSSNIGKGVVGWRSVLPQPIYKTTYIDNYFQNNFTLPGHPDGLAWYPGCNYSTDLSSKKADVPFIYWELITALFPWVHFGDLFMNHSSIHTWYHGTIDPSAQNDGNLMIYAFIDDWFNGDDQVGYNNSRIGGGELSLKTYDTIETELNDVKTDGTYKIFKNGHFFADNYIFNGDFSKHGLSGDVWMPGWHLQGGGGEGNIDGTLGNEYLELNDNTAWLRHNFFYVPKNVNALMFACNVVNRDYAFFPDRLQVLSEEENGFVRFEMPLNERGKSIQILDISRWQGTVKRLIFRIVDSDGKYKSFDNPDIDSEVHIDDVMLVMDSDLDGFPDELEEAFGTLPNDPDTDNDCLKDGIEYLTGKDPLDADSDDDGRIDGNCGTEDKNANGYLDPGETDPLNPDTDGDGIFDGTEVGLTEPETTDTDLSAGNFIADADPSDTTDPTDADSDDDGIIDGNEDKNHDGFIDSSIGETNPGNPDSDGDGIYDGTEIGLTEPQDPEATDLTKGTFIADADPSSVTDPTNSDSDGDGVTDGEEDTNSDGAFDPNLGETDPSIDDRVPGDLDEDGDIDRDDVNIIKLNLNKPADTFPECDIDGDGTITILDARKLMMMCTCPRCVCE